MVCSSLDIRENSSDRYGDVSVNDVQCFGKGHNENQYCELDNPGLNAVVK